MAVHFNDARVEIGANVIEEVRSVSLPISQAELDATVMGDDWSARIGGLKDASVTIEFYNNFADGELDEILWDAFTTGTATVKVRATTEAISASNPEYSLTVLVTGIQPFGNGVGEAASTSVTWPLASGAVSRATS